MALFAPPQLAFAEALSELMYCNPFLPLRMEAERRALGETFVPAPPTWSRADDGPMTRPASMEGERPNLTLLRERSIALADATRARLIAGVAASPRERVLYEDVVLYVLYESCREQLHHAAQRSVAGEDPATRSLLEAWRCFRGGFERYLELPDVPLPSAHRAEHVFACFFQIRRAFSHIYHYLVGTSMPAAELRAAVWQSIFTHDFRRYYRGLYARMADYTTLITGESGTGKELVARAVGRSRYIPFDAARRRFAEDFETGFYPVNLSALSPTLIESELFGHKKGSFTGAVVDRKGFLEECPPLGTVFLDEIGELDAVIQVKLLRVVQSRVFTRLGEARERRFHGKVIAATNRDLASEMLDGRFRRDFYYRLCSDLVRTPSLREQLDSEPEELRRLVHFVALRLLEDGGDAEPLTRDVLLWIEHQLGLGYSWPGNFRELEQCVLNIIIRGQYRPPIVDRAEGDATDRLLAEVREGRLTADELLTRYTRLVYRDAGSYVAAAQRLGIDRRTVRARVDGGGRS